MWDRMEEHEWRSVFFAALDNVKGGEFDFVTGAGRSGAVAAVYASHYLGVPFKPHKAGSYVSGQRVLVVDTVEYTGKTLRKAKSWYEKHGLIVTTVFGVKETRRNYVKMWYEPNYHRGE